MTSDRREAPNQDSLKLETKNMQTIPQNLRGALRPHPTNPNVRVLLTKENSNAIWLIRSLQPSWLEEMPLIAASRNGQRNVSQCRHYDQRTRRGLQAFYFGAGCNPSEAGWEVLCVSGATEAEFNDVAIAQLRHLERRIPT